MKKGFTVFNCEIEEDSICIIVINDKTGNQINNLPWYSPIKAQDQEIGVWKIKNKSVH